MKKLLSIIFPLLLLLLTSFFLQAAMANNPAATSAFCNSKCKVRCSKASAQDRCLTYCRYCCGECSCVPSGTYGNKDECPCYRDLVTKDKKKKPKPKCP